MRNNQKTIYFSIPVQTFITLNIKQPILEAVRNIFASPLWNKLVAIWYLWKAYKAIAYLPEPNLENTWHPNTRNHIYLRDWLFKRCFLDKLRMTFIRRLMNFVIILYDFDPYWRWIIDSVREEIVKLNWEKRGYQDNLTYKWWQE